MVLLGVQVVGRYGFGFSPVWVVETSQYSFVWLSFLAICVGYRRRAHISLEYLWSKSPAASRNILSGVIHVAVLAVGWSMMYGGIVLIDTFSGSLSPGMEIPMAWVYSSLVVSGFVLCLFDVEIGLSHLGLLPEDGRTSGDGESTAE